MRSILTITIFGLVAVALAGCNNSNPKRPAVDASAALPGDDFRNGVVTSATGIFAGEPDQEIQFHGSTVRFHVDTLAVDVAGYNGQEFTLGGNTYHLLIGKDGPTSDPNGIVGLQGSEGSVTWNTNAPAGSG